MGNWVNTHLSPARYGYQFLDDYQETTGNATLNISSSFTYEFTITPKESQVNFACGLKGEITQDPRRNKLGHTFFTYAENGYLRGRIFGSETVTGRAIEFVTNNPIMNNVDVIYIAIVLDFVTKQLLIYFNGIVQPFNWVASNPANYESLANMTDIGTATFPSVFNNATSELNFGKALGYNQFEGIIHDNSYHAKAKTSVEINSTWNQVRNPTPPTLGNIIFASSRLTTPVRERFYKMNEKGGNQALFFSLPFSIILPRVNKSNNVLLDKTKISFFGAGNNGIYVMNVDGSNPQGYLVGTNAIDPSLNFDLTKITYRKDSRIWIADFNKDTNLITNESPVSIYLGNGNYQHFSPTFSPNGTKILFRRTDPPQNELLSIINIDGTGLTDLAGGDPNQDFLYHLFNKAGTKIGYSQVQFMGGLFHYKSQVFTMDNLGGNVKQITGEGFDSFFGDFSPDGNSLIYYQKFTSGNQIFRSDLNGRNKVNISGAYYAGYDDNYGSWY